jgi:hypothetical protein
MQCPGFNVIQNAEFGSEAFMEWEGAQTLVGFLATVNLAFFAFRSLRQPAQQVIAELKRTIQENLADNGRVIGDVKRAISNGRWTKKFDTVKAISEDLRR